MDCALIERPEQVATPPFSKRALWFGRRLAWRLMRTDRMEFDDMPDRIKRDLGLMDGREPRYEREFWR